MASELDLLFLLNFFLKVPFSSVSLQALDPSLLDNFLLLPQLVLSTLFVGDREVFIKALVLWG